MRAPGEKRVWLEAPKSPPAVRQLRGCTGLPGLGSGQQGGPGRRWGCGPPTGAPLEPSSSRCFPSRQGEPWGRAPWFQEFLEQQMTAQVGREQGQSPALPRRSPQARLRWGGTGEGVLGGSTQLCNWDSVVVWGRGKDEDWGLVLEGRYVPPAARRGGLGGTCVPGVGAGWGGLGAARWRRLAFNRPDFPSPPCALSSFPRQALRPPSLVALESSASEF